MNSLAMKILFPYFLLVSIFTISSVYGVDNWTGWLGPNRDGRVTGFQEPDKWPKELERKWIQKVGSGYATPLIIADKIYIHSRINHSEYLSCLNLQSGKLIWRKGEVVPFTMGSGGESHGKGPKSNPIYSDGKIFTFSISGCLSARDASNGRLLWQKKYGKKLKKPHPFWGATTSPVVSGRNVFVHFGSCDDGILCSFNARSGEELWTKSGDGACYSSPLAVELFGVPQLVEWNHRALVGVEIKSGKTLWEFPFPHRGQNQNMPTPAYYEGRFFLGGENRGLKCVRPILVDGQWTVNEEWFQRRAPLDMSSPIISNGLLYGLSHYDRGHLFCLDTSTGEILWKGPPRTGSHATFLSTPNHIISLLGHGELRVLSSTSEGYALKANYKVSDKPTWTAPVLLDDGILIKDVDSLSYWKFPKASLPNQIN